MFKMKNVWVLFLFILAFSCNKEKALNQSFEKIKLSDKEILKEINDCKLFEIDKEKEINDEVSAISVAEPILFSSYGKENILKQRPYKIGKVQNYWVIYGTFNSLGFGGVFEIIIDSKNGKIVRLTHGK